MGRFFGFKLHLIINHQGEIVDLSFTSRNVDDRNPVISLGQNLFGKIFGDRGYVSQNLDFVLEAFGVKYITKPKKKMKKKTLSQIDADLLKKRSIIETVFGEIKSQTNIKDSKHRSLWNFYINLLSSLITYKLKPKKP